MTETPPSVVEAPRAASAARKQKLWAVLLVIDSFFVIVFGGALAAKVYQHWQAPVAPQPVRTHRPVKTPSPVAKTAEPAPAPEPTKPAPPAEPVKTAPVAAKPAAADAPRPPKPSMLQSAPSREAAKPQNSAAASAAPTAQKSGKAVATEFSIKSPGARSVELAGAFIVHGGKKTMISHPDGSWTLTVYLTPNTYRYWFLVNGKKVLDPQNSKTDRAASVVAVGQ